MSIESLHFRYLCNLPGPWLTQQGRCPCTDLLDFLHESPYSLAAASQPLRLLLKPDEHSDFSFPTYRTLWASLANKGYLGSSWHTDPHWASPTSFISSFWLKLWTAHHLFLFPWHPRTHWPLPGESPCQPLQHAPSSSIPASRGELGIHRSPSASPVSSFNSMDYANFTRILFNVIFLFSFLLAIVLRFIWGCNDRILTRDYGKEGKTYSNWMFSKY